MSKNAGIMTTMLRTAIAMLIHVLHTTGTMDITMMEMVGITTIVTMYAHTLQNIVANASTTKCATPARNAQRSVGKHAWRSAAIMIQAASRIVSFLLRSASHALSVITSRANTLAPLPATICVVKLAMMK